MDRPPHTPFSPLTVGMGREKRGRGHRRTNSSCGGNTGPGGQLRASPGFFVGGNRAEYGRCAPPSFPCPNRGGFSPRLSHGAKRRPLTLASRRGHRHPPSPPAGKRAGKSRAHAATRGGKREGQAAPAGAGKRGWRRRANKLPQGKGKTR